MGFHENMNWHNFAQSQCINKGAAQHQEAERMSDTFWIVLIDVNLNSDIVLPFFKSRKYDL